MKKSFLITLLFYSFVTYSQQVLVRTNTNTTTNKSWQSYRQNSPTNVYGNSFVLFEINYDSILLHSGNVKIDILDNRTGFIPSKKFISADNNGYLQQGSFDNLSFTVSQITNLSTMLSDRITFAQASSIYQPIGGYLIGDDTLSMNNRINVKLNKSDTTGKWKPNTWFPSFSQVTGKPTTVSGYGITDIFPSQTGQSGKVLSTNGTNANWISVATYTPPTIYSSVSRSLNTNYTISTTKDADVSYSINASWNISALLSGTGTAYLEYSINAGLTWITANQVSKFLNLLTFSGSDDMNLTGFIPANSLVRIRTSSTNMTITYVRGQEKY